MIDDQGRHGAIIHNMGEDIACSGHRFPRAVCLLVTLVEVSQSRLLSLRISLACLVLLTLVLSNYLPSTWPFYQLVGSVSE
jgi:hypothetical protein